MQTKSDCLFCEIIKEEKDLIYQDENTVAFLDIFPVSKGHILIVPKNHADTWIETSEADISATNITAQKIAKQLLKFFPNQIKGFNILINNGREANQMVFHFHIHVIPKIDDDKGLQIKHSIDKKEKENLEQTRKLLQATLNKKDK
ncbi:MAG: HIT family protein [Spiroplasma sp.]